MDGQKIVIKVGGTFVGLGCAGITYLYGRYMYNKGRRDEFRFAKKIIDGNHEVVKVLLNKLKKEEESRN